jgi:hypothetical protein
VSALVDWMNGFGQVLLCRCVRQMHRCQPGADQQTGLRLISDCSMRSPTVSLFVTVPGASPANSRTRIPVSGGGGDMFSNRVVLQAQAG